MNSTPNFMEIFFAADGFRLRGCLHLPAGNHSPVIIGAHGLFSNADSPKQIALAEQCTENGLAFFRFDFRGCGKSDGEFDQATSLEGRRRDLMQAVEAVCQRPEISGPIGLFGSSLGGAVVLSAAADIRPAAIVTVAAPFRFSNRQALEAIRQAGEYEIPAPGFYQRNLSFDLSAELAALNHILIFHGDQDAVIPLAHAQKIFAAAADPKRLIIQQNGDHRISLPEHQREFIQETTSWFRQYLRP